MNKTTTSCPLFNEIATVEQAEVLGGREPNQALRVTKSMLMDALEHGMGQKGAHFFAEMLVVLSDVGYSSFLSFPFAQKSCCEVRAALHKEIEHTHKA